MSKAIKVENLSKKYLIKHQKQERYTSFRDVMAHTLRGLGERIRHPLSPNREEVALEEFWALKDVNFEIEQGDRVGVIGRNGAGKSTLLKVLSRITEPTSGKVGIKGRVASLLEVGTGFHPELSGRENIFLNGAILGMSKVEITRKFDEIVAFAEVEKFLDTPVKRYSSGMYVRLAFAVAAHLEPEILIVDEVLAVGDAQFQKKCLGKMQDVGKDGRTVLFVSHNMAAIKSLCSKGIVLSKGHLLYEGSVEEAVDKYAGTDGFSKNEVYWKDIAEAPGNEYIRLKSISIKPLQGSMIDVDSGIEVTTVFYNAVEGRSLDFTLLVFTIDGICLFETGIILSSSNDAKVGYCSTRVVIPPHLLNAGVYKIELLFGESQRYRLYKLEDAIAFEVENTVTGRGNNMSRGPGLIRPRLDWSYEYLTQPPMNSGR